MLSFSRVFSKMYSIMIPITTYEHIQFLFPLNCSQLSLPLCSRIPLYRSVYNYIWSFDIYSLLYGVHKKTLKYSINNKSVLNIIYINKNRSSFILNEIYSYLIYLNTFILSLYPIHIYFYTYIFVISS